MKQRDRVGSLKHNERQLDYLRKKEAVSFSFIFWEENVNYKKTKWNETNQSLFQMPW